MLVQLDVVRPGYNVGGITNYITYAYTIVVLQTVLCESEFNVRLNVYIRVHYRVHIGYTYCMCSNNKHIVRGKARKLNIQASLKP